MVFPSLVLAAEALPDPLRGERHKRQRSRVEIRARNSDEIRKQTVRRTIRMQNAQKAPFLPGRDSLSPALGSDGRWYRITSVSWTCPLPAAAQKKSVLTRIRTLS